MIGASIQYGIVVHFCKTLKLLVDCGLPTIETIRATASTMKNKVVRKVLYLITADVLKGNSIPESIKVRGMLFPPLIYNMIKVSEETGGLDKSLDMLSEYYL